MRNAPWLLIPLLALLALACQNLGRHAPTPPATPVDNSRCHVCHINYSEEELAVSHAKAGVGCEKCHGLSDDHCGDEANITPPDILYPIAKVEAACSKCHPSSTTADVDMHRLNPPAGKPNHKRCTQCHGKHLLTRRTVRWNKTTRKLLDD